jgi:hypothetical protein
MGGDGSGSSGGSKKLSPSTPPLLCLFFIIQEALRARVGATFGRLGAARFSSTNRRRNGFHRVASAALEDAVLESSHAGVYALQIHAFATRRAARTFGRQQLR